MKRVQARKDSFVLKPDVGLVLRGVSALFLGFVLLTVLLRFETETAGFLGAGDVAEFLAVCACTVGFWILGTADTAKNCITVVVDRYGVCRKGLFSRKSLLWAEILDFGCFYDRYIRSLEGMYVVYFSLRS